MNYTFTAKFIPYQFMTMHGLGKKLRTLRELKGFTQENISTHIGMSQKTYSLLENGRSDIKMGDLDKISRLLEVSIPDILTFNEKQIIHTIQHSKYVGQNFFNTDSMEWRSMVEQRLVAIERNLEPDQGNQKDN